MINKVYIVEVYFENHESSYSYTIGIFLDKIIAEQAKEKWNKFYIENQSIFAKYNRNSEDDEEINKYYELVSDYVEINEFTNITITELPLNIDFFYSNNISIRSDKMNNLLKEWERNYKLNTILK